MKTAAIIAEYNPFHNGHKLHIEKTRELGATHIIALMSGNVVQRGDVALCHKAARAAAAVESGADLVLELPAVYAGASAERFADGAVRILDALGIVDILSFGSECGDTEKLTAAARFALSENYMANVKLYLRATGVSFPAAQEMAYMREPTVGFIPSPNDTLGIEYCKALQRHGSTIVPSAVLRRFAGHDTDEVSEGVASASHIRELVLKGQLDGLSGLMPESSLYGLLREMSEGRAPARLSKGEAAVLLGLRKMTKERLLEIPDVTEGMEHRMMAAVRSARSIEHLFDSLKTKRYTMSRVRRMVVAGLTGVKKADFELPVPYVHVLAFGPGGEELLKQMKGRCSLPVSTSLKELQDTSPAARRFAEIEVRATDLFGVCTPRILASGEDYTTPAYIKKQVAF